MLRLDINLLWTIINLVILYVLLRKFLFKPVRNILAKRKEEIQKSYDDAARTQQEAQALKEQYAATMQGVEDQAEAQRAAARTKASEEYDKLLSQAHADADRIIADANRQADAAVKAARARANDEIAEMAKQQLSAAAVQGDDAQLYDDFLEQVQPGQAQPEKEQPGQEPARPQSDRAQLQPSQKDPSQMASMGSRHKDPSQNHASEVRK